MRVGRYQVGLNTLLAFRRMLRDTVRVRVNGIPRVVHHTPEDLAVTVLRVNARDVFRAGDGHFHVMWPTDFGKAFAGAQAAVPHEYLAAQVSRMVKTGARLGYVPTCFTRRGHYDLPWHRADNVPWLLHMVARLNDPEFTARHAAALETVYADWVRDHVDESTGLVREDVYGDWMDTVPRPSSTYNNLVALRAYEAADEIGLRQGPTFLSEASKALVDERWTGTHLRDHADAGDYLSADANVPALYLGVLPEHVRHRIADTVEESDLCRPVPMLTRVGRFDRHELPLLTRFVSSYHCTPWLHLGLMYLNGLKRLGRPYKHHLETVEVVIRQHGNFLETLNADGTPHRSWLMTTEYGFSMSAGQYLELVTAPADAEASVRVPVTEAARPRRARS